MSNNYFMSWIRRIRVYIFKKFDSYLYEARKYSFIEKIKYCGKDCELFFPFHVSEPHKLEIGDNVSIGMYVYMWSEGGIKIGNRVMIGSHVQISSATHEYNKEIMRNTHVTKPVLIEDDVWIGTHAVILPGVTIGHGAVVGANSVVTKNIEPMSVVMGSPARLYKYRSISKE